MSIELRQPGEASAVAAAGTAIGAGERAKEERARAERAEEQAAQTRAHQVAQEWDLQKMVLNSQQDFAHEQRLQQAQLEGEARAQEWQVEKMEMASRLDFEAEERERQREYSEFLNTDKYIRDKVTSGELTSEKAEDLFFMNAYQHSKLNKPEIIERLGGSPEYVQKAQGVRTQRPASVSEQKWGLLSPEEQLNVARGLRPQGQKGDLARERRQLEAIVGEVELPSLMSLPELRQRATEIMGTTQDANSTGQTTAVPDPLGIR